MRTRSAALAFALVGTILAVGPAAAATQVTTGHDFVLKQVTTEYFPDDICGPRAGWTTFVLTSHTHWTDQGDGYHFTHGETGTYTTVFDDPSIPSYQSQSTDAFVFNMTRGQTVTYNDEFHDFPGTITIHTQTVFTEVNGQVVVDREVLRVDGCP